MKLKEVYQPEDEFWEIKHLEVYRIFVKVHYENYVQYRQVFQPFSLSKSDVRKKSQEIWFQKAKCNDPSTVHEGLGYF